MIDKIIYKIEHKIKLNDKECEKITQEGQGNWY